MNIFQNFFRRDGEESRFARELIRRMRAAGDPREVTFDPATFQLHFRQGTRSAGTANLRNIYSEYRQREVENRDSYLQLAVRALLSPHKEVPTDFDDVKSDLLPTVRARSYFAQVELEAWTNGHREFRWPHQPLGQHLAVGLVYDLPEAMMMVQQRQLDEWGVSFYIAWESARENLAALPFSYGRIGEHVYVSATGDNYDASRVTLIEQVDQLPVPGRHVMMVPNRDRLLLTGEESAPGLEVILQLAQESLSKEPRPMTGLAFCLDDGQWQPWLPPAEHPLFLPFSELQKQWIGQDYAEQQAALTKWCESQKDPAHVASYSGLRKNEQSSTTSYCVWSEGSPALLPKTDFVFFYRPNGQSSGTLVAQGSWDRVQIVVGDLMRAEDFYPQRYRVHQFPSAAELSEIGMQEP